MTPDDRKATMVTDRTPFQQLEELRTFVFAYMILGPLLSALFAQHIDNRFIVAAIFVTSVATAVGWTRNRMAELETSIRDREEKILLLCRELEGEPDSERDTDL